MWWWRWRRKVAVAGELLNQPRKTLGNFEKLLFHVVLLSRAKLLKRLFFRNFLVESKAKFEKQFLENKNVQQAFLVIFPNSLKWNFPCFWQSRPAQNFAFLKMLFFGIFTKKLDERAKTPNELFHMWWEGTHFLKQKNA